MPSSVDSPVWLIEEDLKQARFDRAWRRLHPALTGKLERRLSGLYEFVGEQDLWAFKPYHPRLQAEECRPALRALRHSGLARPQRAALQAFLWICAADYKRARRILRPEALGQTAPSGYLLLLYAASCWMIYEQNHSKTLLAESHKTIERFFRKCRPSRDARMLRAQIRFKQNKFLAAMADLRSILAGNPQDVAARLGLSEAWADLHDYRQSLSEIQKISKTHGNIWWFLAHRGRLRSLCSRLSLALRDLNRAIRLKPQCGALYSWKGEILRKMGRHALAFKASNRSIRQDPAHAFGWELRGRLHLAQGRLRRAIKDCARARTLRRRILAAVFQGEAWLKLGNPQKAWHDFDAAGEFNPETTWTPPGAFWRDLENLQKRRPRNPWSWLLGGRFKILAGRGREALNDLVRCQKMAPARRMPSVVKLSVCWAQRAFERLSQPPHWSRLNPRTSKNLL